MVVFKTSFWPCKLICHTTCTNSYLGKVQVQQQSNPVTTAEPACEEFVYLCLYIANSLIHVACIRRVINTDKCVQAKRNSHERYNIMVWLVYFDLPICQAQNRRLQAHLLAAATCPTVAAVS